MSDMIQLYEILYTMRYILADMILDQAHKNMFFSYIATDSIIIYQ